MRVIVAQIGARHNYAIPRMLEKSGYLLRLYTDSCANNGIGLIVGKYLPARAQIGSISKLLNRHINGVSRDKIYVADVLLWEIIRQKIIRRDILSYNAKISKLYAREMIKWGTDSATMIYSMFGEGLEFLRYAKSTGVKIAIEVFITPISHRIIREERRLHPNWEAQDPEANDELYDQYVTEVIDLADLLICPSQSVINGLYAYPNFDIGKARIVHYGCGIDFGNSHNLPQPRRVLFVGQANLRKGIYYLAEASQILAAAGKNYDIRVVGSVSERIRKKIECRYLNFVGQIPRLHVIDELMSAAVFVLPTLAEGSATVIHEALIAGVPVITTERAGSRVRDGVDGMIVPERNPTALAEAICNIVEDRATRDAMAIAAQENKEFYSEEEWSIRLNNAFQSCSL